MDKTVYMMEMTWLEVRKAIEENRILIFSVGTLEQHGPHLPLGVDTYLPLEVSRRVAEAVGAVVAPVTSYGYKSLRRAGGGPHFPGSVGLKGVTLVQVVKDLIGEFIQQGWRRFLVLDWHLENIPFVYEGVDEAIRASGKSSEVKFLIVDNPNGLGVKNEHELQEYLFGPDFPGWDVEHAAIWETSAMLAAYPHLVKKDEIIDGTPPDPADYDILPAPVGGAPESGVFWKATRASEEKGERILAAVTGAIVALIKKEFDQADG